MIGMIGTPGRIGAKERLIRASREMSVPPNFTRGRTPRRGEPSGREGVKSDEIVKLLGHVGRHICEMDLGTHAAQIPQLRRTRADACAHTCEQSGMRIAKFMPRGGGGPE